MDPTNKKTGHFKDVGLLIFGGHFNLAKNVELDKLMGIRDYFGTDDCCFPNEETAECFRQEFNRDKIWMIYICIAFHQIPG